MTEINLCSPTHEEQSAEINLCSSEQEEQDREIKLCPNDCADPPPLVKEPISATPEGNTLFSVSGGIPPYDWETSCGAITDGILTNTDSCQCTQTVEATDACGQMVLWEVAYDMPELFLAGPDEPEVNDHYSASGGIEPYTFSFTGGAIDSTGKITAVTSCGGPSGNGAVASVTVTDFCGQSASIEVRLPGGGWSQIGSEQGGTCGTLAGDIERITGGTKRQLFICSNASGLMTPGWTEGCSTAHASTVCGLAPVSSPNITVRSYTGDPNTSDDRYYCNLHVSSCVIWEWVCP